jgi:hypothetical protein
MKPLNPKMAPFHNPMWRGQSCLPAPALKAARANSARRNNLKHVPPKTTSMYVEFLTRSKK